LIVVSGEKLARVEVRQDRTSMQITPAEVELLRIKCRGAGRTMCEAMKRRADGMLGTKARLDNQGRYYLPTYATMYLISNERRYADKAREWFLPLSTQTIQNPWSCLEYIPAAADYLEEHHPHVLSTGQVRVPDLGLSSCANSWKTVIGSLMPKNSSVWPTTIKMSEGTARRTESFSS
jgi:hypothetical protein